MGVERGTRNRKCTARVRAGYHAEVKDKQKGWGGTACRSGWCAGKSAVESAAGGLSDGLWWKAMSYGRKASRAEGTAETRWSQWRRYRGAKRRLGGADKRALAEKRARRPRSSGETIPQEPTEEPKEVDVDLWDDSTEAALCTAEFSAPPPTRAFFATPISLSESPEVSDRGRFSALSTVLKPFFYFRTRSSATVSQSHSCLLEISRTRLSFVGRSWRRSQAKSRRERRRAVPSAGLPSSLRKTCARRRG